MSGHSKWATIKHKKGAIDKARGKLFAKLARQLEVAARSGGMDVDTNASLRTMVQKAKAGQMTKDLALLIGPDQPWQTTQEFLASIDENLQKAMASK